MATYELDSARERFSDLFQEARDGKEVVILRLHGVSCKWVAASEVWAGEPAVIPPGSNKP